MRKPSPTLIIASLALVFAMTGTGLAASRYLITSKNQIAPSVLKELRGKRGPIGVPGAAGPAGVPGASGAAGTSFTTSDVVETQGSPVTLTTSGANGSAGGSFASCPAGSVVLGGGWLQGTPPPINATVSTNGPIADGTAWDVVMTNNNGVSDATFTAYAICGS